MVTKAFEVRDRMTFIPALAVKLESTDPVEIWIMWKGGYHPQANETFVVMVHLGRGEGKIDAFEWKDRTMSEAHKYVAKNFDKLKTGDIIDVEFILGETTVKKTTERDRPAKTPVKVPFVPVDRYPAK
jgi:hypothetical protein